MVRAGSMKNFLDAFLQTLFFIAWASSGFSIGVLVYRLLCVYGVVA